MPLVDKKAKEALQKHKHDYSKMSEQELEQIVKGVSTQDAGNYDGKFCGMMASNELIFRSAKKTQFWTTVIAVASLGVAVISLFLGTLG